MATLGIPNASVPFLLANGQVSPAWFSYLRDLNTRISGTSGGAASSLLSITSQTLSVTQTGNTFDIEMKPYAQGQIMGQPNPLTGAPSVQQLSSIVDADTNFPGQGSIYYRDVNSWLALSPGTSGYVLSTNGAGANPTWVPQSGGGGGGSNPYTVPVTGSFTWNHQPVGSTAADTTTGLAMYAPSTGTVELSSLQDAAAYHSTPFTVTTGIRSTLLSTNFPSAGVYVTDGTKFIVLVQRWNGSFTNVEVQYWNTNTSYNSTPAPYSLAPLSDIFLAIKDDGTTNFTFYAGAEMSAMVPLGTLGRGAWLAAPTAVGIAINQNSNGGPLAATFFHYLKA